MPENEEYLAEMEEKAETFINSFDYWLNGKEEHTIQDLFNIIASCYVRLRSALVPMTLMASLASLLGQVEISLISGNGGKNPETGETVLPILAEHYIDTDPEMQEALEERAPDTIEGLEDVGG
jgi:hypothetical protein